MLIPIWYADWEYPCGGEDIRVGDAVEWGGHWRCLPASSDEESPRLAVLAGTGIEAVWRWQAMQRNADGVDTLAAWRRLRIGVCLPSEQHANGAGNRYVNGRFVQGRGRLWREHHIVGGPIAAAMGTVREICRHPRMYWCIDERHSQFKGHGPGVATGLTSDKSSGDFRFMVEIDVGL